MTIATATQTNDILEKILATLLDSSVPLGRIGEIGGFSFPSSPLRTLTYPLVESALVQRLDWLLQETDHPSVQRQDRNLWQCELH
jgi:hypothetical protein